MDIKVGDRITYNLATSDRYFQEKLEAWGLTSVRVISINKAGAYNVLYGRGRTGAVFTYEAALYSKNEYTDIPRVHKVISNGSITDEETV